jgi:hypothetical protein
MKEINENAITLKIELHEKEYASFVAARILPSLPLLFATILHTIAHMIHK